VRARSRAALGSSECSDWQEPHPTVTGRATVSGGTTVAAVADPRITPPCPMARRSAPFTRATTCGAGSRQRARSRALAVTEATESPIPRVLEAVQLGFTPRGNSRGHYGVTGWAEAAATVTGSARASTTGRGR
jgi:hypothetical protein